ncbi:MAG TPA: hypothetical protein VI636_10165 [Candidatus Angelobacter sp.]
MTARPIFTVVLLLSLLALSQNPGTNSATQGQQRAASVGLAVPTYQADFTPVIANGVHLISWDNGHLVSFGAGEMREPVTLYAKTGKWLFEKWPSFEGAMKIYGQDAAVTSTGAVVLSVSAVSPDGAVADMIVEMGRDGIRRVIRTSPFYALRVCTTAEGTVWAYGKEYTDDRRGERRIHYPMLREYSFEKGELRSDLDRATLHVPKGVPVDGGKREFQMRCGSGKVILVSGPTNELMEYDLSASKLGRWPITPLPEGFYINGAAITASGEIYASAFRPGQNALTSMLHLHVNPLGVAEWTALTTVPSGGKFFVLLGNDGEDLVYSRGRSTPTLFWSAATKSEATR